MSLLFVTSQILAFRDDFNIHEWFKLAPTARGFYELYHGKISFEFWQKFKQTIIDKFGIQLTKHLLEIYSVSSYHAYDAIFSSPEWRMYKDLHLTTNYSKISDLMMINSIYEPTHKILVEHGYKPTGLHLAGRNYTVRTYEKESHPNIQFNITRHGKCLKNRGVTNYFIRFKKGRLQIYVGE